MLATYREAEDLINIGAYVRGSNPRIDRAVKNIEPIRSFLRQLPDERAEYGESLERLLQLSSVE
jgi:flagellum-specific ATP synthase